MIPNQTAVHCMLVPVLFNFNDCFTYDWALLAKVCETMQFASLPELQFRVYRQ